MPGRSGGGGRWWKRSPRSTSARTSRTRRSGRFRRSDARVLRKMKRAPFQGPLSLCLRAFVVSLLLVRAEHPRHLLVLLHETGEEVGRARVAVAVLADRLVRPERADDRLVVAEEVREHRLGAGVLAGMLLQASLLLELAHRAQRLAAQRARALGHLVQDLVELLVLRVEELVKVVELRPDDVPVIVARLGQEHHLI